MGCLQAASKPPTYSELDARHIEPLPTSRYQAKPSGTAHHRLRQSLWHSDNKREAPLLPAPTSRSSNKNCGSHPSQEPQRMHSGFRPGIQHNRRTYRKETGKTGGMLFAMFPYLLHTSVPSETGKATMHLAPSTATARPLCVMADMRCTTCRARSVAASNIGQEVRESLGPPNPPPSPANQLPNPLLPTAWPCHHAYLPPAVCPCERTHQACWTWQPCPGSSKLVRGAYTAQISGNSSPCSILPGRLTRQSGSIANPALPPITVGAPTCHTVANNPACHSKNRTCSISISDVQVTSNRLN